MICSCSNSELHRRRLIKSSFDPSTGGFIPTFSQLFQHYCLQISNYLLDDIDDLKN